ncbi:MAG: PhzF family phenazine biosynthesis protein [Desulfitobacteriaceae bacterium]|nr:PhzF family phenazine biosynthesis protein [Desulfitobacteriaceae bacterium]MDD4752218.1 PhzF family phenazine biosynthesis protein [Desulfitobacteriaceae bacterium]
MKLKIYQVDAFADKPFSGNPAAVCVLEGRRDVNWMQNIAKEMNLSETAFLIPKLDGYELRWFTPTTEVNLCGHATLASAHILWEEGYLDKGRIAKFYSKSGLLTARLNGSWIELDFPAAEPQEVQMPTEIIKALNIKPIYWGKSIYYIFEVDSEQLVRTIEPDFEVLKEVLNCGVIVTSKSTDSDFDFVSRFFDPVDGIDEDPVTGSAHCVLGPYWSKKLSKTDLIAYQASERGGILKIRVEGDRVIIGGKAITVLRGELNC